jgi:hypothetical protein
VSLRAAANYRNSQRAYFLARSGFGVFARFPELRNYYEPGKLEVVPYVTEGDKVLQIMWEDEESKINVASNTSETLNRLEKLFDILQIDPGKFDQIRRWMAEARRGFYLLTELHRFLSDEEYTKVAPFLTVYSSSQNALNAQNAPKKININTATETVLNSVISARNNPNISLSTILSKRKEHPYGSGDIGTDLSADFMPSSNVFKIYSQATCGGFTKQIEAVIDLTNSKVPLYWRAL